MKTLLLTTMTAVLLAGCTSISVTETTDDKTGDAIAIVSITETAVEDVESFVADKAAKIFSVCTILRERAVAKEAAAKAAAEKAEAAAKEAAEAADLAKATAKKAAEAMASESDRAKAEEAKTMASEKAKDSDAAAKVAAKAAADAMPPAIVVEMQSVLGLLKAARELLPVNEYVRTCLLQQAPPRNQ